MLFSVQFVVIRENNIKQIYLVFHISLPNKVFNNYWAIY